MNAIILKRNKSIYEMKNNIRELTKKYDSLMEELRTINERRILETKKIINDAQVKCDREFNEQMQRIRQDSLETIKKIRSDADNVMKNLDTVMSKQVDEIAQQLFEKLFTNLENKR